MPFTSFTTRLLVVQALFLGKRNKDHLAPLTKLKLNVYNLFFIKKLIKN